MCRRLGECLKATFEIPHSSPDFLYEPRSNLVSCGLHYVIDKNNRRIQKFETNGSFLDKWGVLGTEPGQFHDPTGMAVDSQDNLYVTDFSNYRVQKFDSQGNFLLLWGELGTGNGQFKFPTDVAVAGTGEVYVTDLGNHRVQQFDSKGRYLAQWGSYGTGDGQFNRPSGIAVDWLGNVYVADLNNNRIQKFDGNGHFLTRWGSAGAGPGQFQSPADVAVDPGGSVYVADRDNHRIQKFDGNGNFLGQWGEIGNGAGQFNQPVAIAADAAGYVYISDQKNHRIQKFNFPSSLSLNKTVRPNLAWTGQRVTYSLVVINVGQVSATQVLISDTLDSRLSLAGPVVMDPPQSTAILAKTAISLPVVAGQVTISAATRITLTLPVTVEAGLSETAFIPNLATVTGSQIITPITGSTSFWVNPKRIYLPLIEARYS